MGRPLLGLAAAALMLTACGESEAPSPQPDPVAEQVEAGWQVDTVGVVNLAEGDTVNLDAGLTIIETTRIFPPAADNGEVIGWEFQAAELRPVKLLILKALDDGQRFELLGESPLVVPRRLGANRFELPEAIPLEFPSLFGLYMPEAGAVPFRKVRNWKTLIMARPFQRPFTERAPMSMYGWRYSVRVFWRKATDPATGQASPAPGQEISG